MLFRELVDFAKCSGHQVEKANGDFYHVVGFHIYLMACYAKNEQEDLRPEVKKQLKVFVEQIKKGV